jgi:hypothetical protein
VEKAVSSVETSLTRDAVSPALHNIVNPSMADIELEGFGIGR